MKSRNPLRSEPAPWAWALGGVATGLLVSCIAFAPAQWLADGLARASANRLQLLNAQGTLWRGSAEVVLAGGTASQAHTRLPGRVDWRLHPTWQGLHAGLRAECCLPTEWVWTAHPSLSGVQIQVSDAASVWPSALLAGLGTPWNTLQLQGGLTLSTQQLVAQWQAGQWSVSGTVQLDATQMSTSLSTLKPVGSYRLLWSGGVSPRLNLSTLDGALQLQGAGQWVGGRLQFEGEARATPERAEALANLLNIIGRRDGARAIIKVG